MGFKSAKLLKLPCIKRMDRYQGMYFNQITGIRKRN
jgi:hypothetical protein